MTDSFVGFARSPKPDSRRKVQTRKFEVKSNKAFAECHWIYTTAEGLSRWLGEIEKFDFRPGGKLRYKFEGESFGATYSTTRVPGLLVLVTETLGEVSFSAKVKTESFALKVSIRKALLSEETNNWNYQVDRLETTIAAALQ